MKQIIFFVLLAALVMGTASCSRRRTLSESNVKHIVNRISGKLDLSKEQKQNSGNLHLKAMRSLRNIRVRQIFRAWKADTSG